MRVPSFTDIRIMAPVARPMARVLLLMAATGAMGCGGDGAAAVAPVTPPPKPDPVAAVTIAGDSSVLVPGATRQLTATPRDAAGAPLVGRAVSWGTTAPAVATVSATGLVTAISPGQVTITAASESVTARLTLTVLTPVTVGVGPQIGILQMPSGRVGSAYSYRIPATGGDGRYAFSLASGRLPAGLTLAADGLVSGTPTAADSVELTLRVSSAGVSGDRSVRLLVFGEAAAGETGSCGEVWDVSPTGGGVRALVPTPGAGTGTELCVRLPASASGRTLVVLAPETWAGLIGSVGDVAPPQVAYEVQASRSAARRLGTWDSIPNPPPRPARTWTPIVAPGGPQTAPTQYNWLWIGRSVPTRLVHQGQFVNYYEDTTAASALRGTLAEWQAIDAAVTRQWAAMDTLYGPLVDLDRDGRFSIVSQAGISGANAFYSVCAVAPGWNGLARDTLQNNCSSEKSRENAVIPLLGIIRRATPAQTAERIIGPILHETVHARQHMMTLQVPGRNASENPCGFVMFFRTKPTSPSTDCGYYGLYVRSTLWAEGSANSVLPVLLDGNWSNSCLSGLLRGQCNLDDEAYNNGQFFWAWMILRAGRSLWTETLQAALSATTAVDALRVVTGQGEGTWHAMFLASLMLDDTPLGERLGLHWPGIPLASRMGFSSGAAQWAAHPTLAVGSYEAVRLRYGGGTALRINHTGDVTLRLRGFSGGGTTTVLVVPGAPR
jgi:hypothetical protein